MGPICCAVSDTGVMLLRVAGRDDRRRVTIWLSSAEMADLEAAAGAQRPGARARAVVVAATAGAAGRLPRATSARIPVSAAGVAPDLAVAGVVRVEEAFGPEAAERARVAGDAVLDPSLQPLAALDPVVVAERRLTEAKASPLRPGETIVQRNIRIADARRALQVASGR
jgi:hypothetical protein